MLAIETTKMYGLGGTQLGGLKDDMVRYLGPFIGTDKAVSIYDSIMSEIQTQAGIGAKSKVMPLLIGMGALTGIVAAISISTAIAVRKK